LRRIAERHGIPLIFDAAHGFGAQHRGVPLGASGWCEIFSMSPTKLVPAGEGGMVTTDDAQLAQALTRLREYGNDGNYNLTLPGMNGRLPELSALLALKSFERLPAVAARKRELAAQLKALLQDTPGISWQKVHDADVSSYKDLTCAIDERQFGLTRDGLERALTAEGVETRRYFDPPCHQHSYWSGRARTAPSGLSVTERLCKGVLTLPLYSRMSGSDVERLAAAINRIHRFAPSIRRMM
ncbi:MAG TPA: DegT/DnrJ/EryC1/StrS family aminotransferase, partial [Candidatus Obscuribacterales bacterium]